MTSSIELQVEALNEIQALLSFRNESDVLLTTKQLHQLTGNTERFFEELRTRGGGPRFVRLGSRTIRYRLSDVRVWIESNVKESTAQY